MKHHILIVSTALVFGSLMSIAVADSGNLNTNELWGDPKDFGNKPLNDARNNRDQAQQAADKSAQDQADEEATKEGLNKAAEQATQAYDLAKQALELYKTLSEEDARIDPDYQPQGSPDIPSQCAEDQQCSSCYEAGQKKLNGGRKGLEKLRGIYEYTHKVAKQGEEFMNGVASAAGNGAGLAAAYETQKVDASLDGFDAAAKSKRIELLGGVTQGLKMISSCEAKYYKNDDWYNRYGFMYDQFMLARYEDIGK